MKTTKRTMTKDHVEIERYIRGLNCTYNGWKARWTRKNREARLRHKIAVLQRKVNELERDLEYACTSQF